MRKSKDKPCFYKGRHYTEYVDDVKRLKRDGRVDDVESLLLMLVEATEEEDRYERMGWPRGTTNSWPSYTGSKNGTAMRLLSSNGTTAKERPPV